MKPPKKLAAVAAFALTATTALAQDLIVATDTAFVPFEFKQGDKYVGFDIDMWDAIATDLGVTYELRPMGFMEHGKIAVDGDPHAVIDTPPNPRMKDFLSHVE